jgi:hypothetical protein
MRRWRSAPASEHSCDGDGFGASARTHLEMSARSAEGQRPRVIAVADRCDLPWRTGRTGGELRTLRLDLAGGSHAQSLRSDPTSWGTPPHTPLVTRNSLCVMSLAAARLGTHDRGSRPEQGRTSMGSSRDIGRFCRLVGCTCSFLGRMSLHRLVPAELDRTPVALRSSSCSP